MGWISKFFRDKQETSIEVMDTWEVRWMGRHGAFSHNTSPQIKLCKDKESAELFAEALRDAFKLVKNTSESRTVKVTKSEV